MRNLLEETVKTITYYDHTEDDVTWVGSRDGTHALPWEQVRPLLDFEYDDGYGGQVIASDFVVVFTDGSWLERGEYDGSEWWQFRRAPRRQPDALPFAVVGGDGHYAEGGIARMNRPTP